MLSLLLFCPISLARWKYGIRMIFLPPVFCFFWNSVGSRVQSVGHYLLFNKLLEAKNCRLNSSRLLLRGKMAFMNGTRTARKRKFWKLPWQQTRHTQLFQETCDLISIIESMNGFQKRLPNGTVTIATPRWWMSATSPFFWRFFYFRIFVFQYSLNNF